MQQTQTNAPPPLASPGLVSGGVIPAAPPSRSEVERKLSFRSAAPRDLPKKKRSPSQVSTDSDHSISSHGIGYSTSTSAQSNLIGQSQGQNQAQGQNQSQIGSAPSSGFSAPSSSGLSGGGGVGTGIGINTNPNAPLLSSSNPTSPSLSPAPSIPGLPSSTPQTPGTGQGQGMHGLSAIAERLSGTAIGEDMEEYEEEHEHGNSGSEGEGGEGEGEEGESAQERAERVQGQMRMDDERVMRSGYLYKKQEKRKVWKKKWFVLRTGKLAYYKDDREYSLSRVIDLRDIHTAAPVKIKKHSFTFGIVTKQRTFLAEASSQSEMDEWVAAITGAKRKLTDEAEKRATAGPGQAHAAQGGDVGGGGGKGAGEMVMSPAQLHPAPGQGLPGVHMHSAQGYATSGATGAVLIGQPPTHGQGQGQGQIQGSRRNPSMTSTSARSARREPSASSLSSVGHGDYFPRNASTSGTANIAGGGVALAPPLSASAGTSPMSMSHVQVLPAHAHQGPQGQVQGLSSDSEDDHESHANFSDFGTSLGAGSLYMDGIGTGHQAGQGQGQAQNAGVARSPSTGLTLNLNVPGTGKTIVSQAQAQQHPNGVGGGTPMQTPSAQQAQQHPQKQSQQQQAYLGNVDPSRVILSGYLMKRSHGRGRKVWRKRWWVLTSAGLTYAKSHMDTKASRHIPLSSILDALEQPADSSQDGSDSDSDGHGHGPQRSASKSMRSPSMRRGSSFMPIPMPGSGAGSSRADGVLGTSFSGEPGSSLGTSVTGSAATSGAGVGSSGMAHSPSAASALGGSGTGSSGNAGQGGDHLFRLITAKRTFTLCAPTEEDEIKWLAGVKALLNRERERSQAQAQAQAQSQAAKQAQNAGAGPGVGVGSPNMGEVPRMFPAQQSQQTQQHQQQPQQQGGVPRITQQPPTPSLSPNAPSTSHVASPPTPQQQQQQHPQQPGSPTSPTSPTSLSGRGRSATYTAKSAVEEVVRRYHPERQAQAS